VRMDRWCIATSMNTTSIPGIFSRYTNEKYNRFQTWLNTRHGQTVYALFRKFSEMYRNAGHDRCGANLIGNRIRWEMSVGEYVGYKVSNDFLPMLARQMVIDQPDYAAFFTFHDEATKKALQTAVGSDSDTSI
jgi:hypothetical protein